MQSQTAARQPLQGIRVLEFGSLLAGPLCARILGDFGADVIKVEAPGAGDPLRVWGQDRFNDRDILWTIYALAMGILLALLASWSGGLLAPIVAHFTVNYFGLVELSTRPSETPSA